MLPASKDHTSKSEDNSSYRVIVDVDPRKGVSEFVFTANVSSDTNSDLLHSKQCCSYTFQDNRTEEIISVSGSTSVNILKKYPPAKDLPAGTYSMNVTAYLHEKNDTKSIYPVATNVTHFHLTENFNGYLTVIQSLVYQTNWSAFIIHKPICVYFYLTDHIFGTFTYHWQINGTIGKHTDIPLLVFTASNIGLSRFSLHAKETRSGWEGHFDSVVLFQAPIDSAFISGDKRTFDGEPTTLTLHFKGSGPVRFCWTLLPSQNEAVCIEDVLTNGSLSGSCSILVQPNNTGTFSLLGNVSNYISWRNVKYSFEVIPKANINSIVLVPVLVVAVFMSAMLSYLVFRNRRQKVRIVEAADFDFHPELTAEIEMSSSLAYRFCPALYQLFQKLRRSTWGRGGGGPRRVEFDDKVQFFPSRKRSLSVPTLQTGHTNYYRQQSQSLTDLDSISDS
ncbi:Hypothetical predicted protein [Octopus vulgaris]|uniref:Transmembrane protein 130 n=1 Tax=Octopus vulgaris TaxID=6645 RepID=A0AA36FN47_OCTVU|nr:Hypothetical predicted protein [Octopus vulgaris]